MQRGCWFTGAVVVLLNPPELIITNEDDNTVVHPLKKELRLSHICSPLPHIMGRHRHKAQRPKMPPWLERLSATEQVTGARTVLRL